jgi:hypothetical protein
MVRLTLLLSLLAAVLHAQLLRVFSEFVRFGSDGEPSVPLTPREILSPAMARNAFTTFQILVKGATGSTSSLWVGQNPENSFQVTLYREKAGRLMKVSQPVDIEGTEVVWMDVWVTRDTPVARMKLEPELYVHQDWVIYPMEVRIVEATVPDGSQPYGAASAMDVMRTLTCGTKLDLTRTPRDTSEPLIPANLSFRNALADVALAQRAPKEEVQRIFGPCNQAAPENPESYLRIRDYLLRLR